MAASTMDGALLPGDLDVGFSADTSMILRHRLLGSIMPSVLHELSQPLTCVMVDHAIARRVLASDAYEAFAALDRAKEDIARTHLLIESMELLSSAHPTPTADLNLNEWVDRALILLRRELYDRSCTVAYEPTPLPMARFSSTTALEAILRAILLAARSASCASSTVSAATLIVDGGDFVRFVLRRLGPAGPLEAAAATECANYPHIVRAIQSQGGRIMMSDNGLAIDFPVASEALRQNHIDV